MESALYGRQDINDAYLTGILSYARHQTSTDRVVNLGGANQYRGDFASDGVAGAFEAGYEFDWFKPYAGVRGQIVSTSGYSETTEAGSEMYALTYDPRVALNARTEIGARFDWSTEFEGGSVMLTSSVAWAHTFAGANTATASYSALGAGSEFTVSGATPSRDAVLLAAGIGVELDSGFDIGSELNASIASNARSYGASVRLGYSW